MDNEQSNFQGQNHGDEYFADLDLIEIVERMKDGYEEDVVDPEDDDPRAPPSPNMSTEDEDEPVQDVDQEFVPKLKPRSRPSDRISRSKLPQVDGGEDNSDMSLSEEDIPTTKDTPTQDNHTQHTFTAAEKIYINDLISKPDPYATGMVVKKKWSEVEDVDILVQHPSQVDGAMDDSDDDDYEIIEERLPQRSGFSAPTGMSGPKKKDRFKSTRKFFGSEEEAYTMDAKFEGNIGRYLNHCCDPNCFVQSVFVDTHDLRFHWVAFFAHCHISAGSELHWDYSYEPGQIPGRELICKCGAEKCRNRLL